MIISLLAKKLFLYLIYQPFSLYPFLKSEELINDEAEDDTPEKQQQKEQRALHALRHWHEVVPDCPLVPEHVETRKLFHPDKPGIEQVCMILVYILHV